MNLNESSNRLLIRDLFTARQWHYKRQVNLPDELRWEGRMPDHIHAFVYNLEYYPGISVPPLPGP